jgi:hypothetical protein
VPRAVAVVLVFALCGIGAARVPSGQHEALCIPLLMKCGTPTPSPTPSPTPTGPLGGLAPIIGSVTGGASDAAGGVAAVVATPDPDAPVMTLPAAQLGGSSLSFTGLKSVSLVTVPLANGSRTPVIKLVADSITITDFLLDVRPAHDTGALVTNSGVMTLRGNVTAYLDSVTGTLLDGTGLSLGVAADPPPGNELPSQLLRVNLGLVGVTANSITLIPSHQEIHN